MNKDVLVGIRGLQFAETDIKEASTDEDLEKIETICPGEYYFRNNAHFILYEERFEGFDEPVKNVLKLREKEFSRLKKGMINVHMVFSEGKKTLTEYATPFGTILLALDTYSIGIEQGDDHLDISICYGMEANYQFIADCNISIKIRETNKIKEAKEQG